MRDTTPHEERTRPDHRRLFEVASEQGGYFTTGQAAACGFTRASLSYHAGRARFTRVRRGLYRLAEYPASPREDVVAAWLAAGKDAAVVSHESALDLLDLSDVVPDRVHLTVPRAKRSRPRVPGTALHTTTRPLGPEDIVTREGLPVTSPTRSIVDSAETGAAPDQMVAAVREAVTRGLVTRHGLLTQAHARGARVERLIRQALAETPVP